MFWSVLNQIRLRQARNNSQIGSSLALIGPPSTLLKQYSCLFALLIFALASTHIEAASVSDGVSLAAARSNCSGCHTVAQGNPPTIAANLPSLIQAQIASQSMPGNDAGMGSSNFTSLTADNLKSLSLWLGQAIVPTPSDSSLTVSYGSSNTVDVTTLLGTGKAGGGTPQDAGGIITTAASHGAISVSGQNIRYTHTDLNYAGTDAFTYQVRNPAGISVSKTITVTIPNPATPVVSSLSVTTGTGGTPFNSQINAINSPQSYSVSGGSLPPGLLLDQSSGLISGTPTQSGTFNFTANATRNAGNTGSRAVSITINPTTPVITSATPPGGATNVVYTPFQASADYCLPVACIWAGTLPAGLSISTSGRITGTPTASGTFTNQSISAQNAVGTGTQSFTMVVSLTPPVITSGAPNSGSTGVAYSFTVTASNSPTSFLISAGALPPGLSINNSGVISGTPTANGTYSFSVVANNGADSAAQNTSITISLASPTINSATTAAGIEGQLFTTYQITSASPISTYGLTGTLPNGLIFTAATGRITGTAASGSPGSYVVSVSATNGSGTATQTLTVTINYAAPVAGNKSGFTVPANIATPVDLTSSITGTSASVNVVATPAHGTFTQSGNIVTYTPLANYLGPDSFTYNATAPSPGGGTSIATGTVSFTVVAAPTGVSPAQMAVPLNTSTILDLSPFISGTQLTGVRVVNAAEHGSVSVNGKVVTYTPVNDYFGADSFTYQAFGAGGTSPSNAIVTITIVGRPDPTQNANVSALMTAQMDAAQRFNRAQLSNFQQRMEFLHRRSPAASGSANASSGGGLGIALQPATTLQSIDAQSAILRAQDNKNQEKHASQAGDSQIAQASTPTAQSLPSQTPTQQAMFAYQNNPSQMSDTDNGVLGLLNGPVGNSLLAALTSNSVNIAALSKGLGVGGTSSEPDAVQIWVAGNLRFGSINNGVNSGYTNFRTDGVTIGADKRLNENFVMGIGVGYAFDTAKVGTDGSKTESNGMSVAMYGSYQPTARTFLDGLIGYGVMKFDTDRFVASVNDFAQGSRNGDQVFASLASGYEFRESGFMLSPYGRVDLSYTRLKETTEKGAGLNALHYDSQDARFAQLALGLRVEAIHQTRFGLALPRARIEYQSSYQEGGNTSIQYADQLGTSYRLSGASDSRNAVVAGVGSDFIMKNGVRFALDYQTLRSAGYESSQAVSVRLVKDFDAPVNQTPFANSDELTMPKLGVRVDMGYTFDDNVNRTKIRSEKEIDRIFSINLTKSNNIQLGPHTRLVLTGFLGGERAYYFNGLDRVTGGGQAEYQYRRSGDFLAPTYGIFGRAVTEQYNSVLRDGYRYTAGISMRKPWTDRISTFAALSHIQKNAKDQVFDTKELSLRGNVDYNLSSTSTLYLTGEYRHGDILSTGAPSLENLDGSTARARDDVFVRQNFATYRFDGDTVLATLGYNLSLGPTDGLDFSWRRVESTPSSVPDYVAHKKSYVDNQYSIVYLVRF